MTVEDKVRSAASPQEAMLALARGIDALITNANAQPDPWGQSSWTRSDPNGTLPEPTPTPGQAPSVVRAVQDAEAIRLLEDALAIETDAEERLAMEARLRLLKETGGSMNEREVGDVYSSEGDEESDSVTVSLKTPSAEKYERRHNFAEAMKLEEMIPLPADEAYDAYAKGGPLWLYLGNRPVVMSLPYEWRQRMVMDVEEDSPRAAQEMARDILKDFDPAGTMDTTLEAIQDD